MSEELQEIFQYISILLDYPGDGWSEAAGEIRHMLSEIGPELADMTGPVARFLDEAERLGERLKEQYVRTFDFGKKTNLYMTYARYGEERERGPALLQLKLLYEKAGFELVSSELTDYLPLLLEFVSIAPLEEAVSMMESLGKRLEELREELVRAGSLYAGLLDALLIGGTRLAAQCGQATIGERG